MNEQSHKFCNKNHFFQPPFFLKVARDEFLIFIGFLNSSNDNSRLKQSHTKKINFKIQLNLSIFQTSYRFSIFLTKKKRNIEKSPAINHTFFSPQNKSFLPGNENPSANWAKH
jgi:hypothetical protein